MANKNNHVVIATFPSADKAYMAGDQLNNWDNANDAVKLGGIALLTWEDDKVKTSKIGGRSTGKGAKWGLALGVVAGVLSGGVTLIGGAIAGAAGGAVLGALFHRDINISDEDKQALEQNLQNGGAAVVAMADEDEVAATSGQLTYLGGAVKDYQVPQETMEKVETAEDVQPAEPPEDQDK